MGARIGALLLFRRRSFQFALTFVAGMEQRRRWRTLTAIDSVVCCSGSCDGCVKGQRICRLNVISLGMCLVVDAK